MAQRALISRAIRNGRALVRAQEWGDSSIPAPSTSMFAEALKGNGDGAGALAISTVFACVKVLSDDFLALPFLAYKGDPRGARSVNPIQPDIVTKPFGPDVPTATGIAQIVVSRAMRGNAFLEVTARDPIGYPTQLKVLHPDKVRAEWAPSGRKQFRLGYNDIRDTTQIIHIQGLTMPGAAGGVDVLTAQRITWALAMHAIEYADSYFEEGGDSSGVISVPGAVNKDKARLIRDLWQAGNLPHVPHVLSGGATWQAMTVTPENAQFLQTRRFSREDICGIFGVPLQRVQAIVENTSQGGGKGVDAIDAGYVRHSLLPIAHDIQAAFNPLIPGDLGTWTGFDWDALLEPAAHERAQIAQIHRMASIRTSNEIRGAEGWAPLTDPRADDAFQPTNANTGGSDNQAVPAGTISEPPTDGGEGNAA